VSKSTIGNLVERAEGLGYDYVSTPGELAATRSDKVLGLFANEEMFEQFPEGQGDEYAPVVPLTTMTAKALDILSRDRQGFFLLVEEEAIDEFAHNTNAARTLQAGQALDATVALVREYVAKHKDTLVVVVGDHGEAFGRHGQSGHASMVYEENVHVPFVLINPRLFKGETFDAVGGVVDVAPTVLDLMALPAPPRWQGRSLFDPGRGGRTYFFAPWSDYLFGMREGNLKTIYNATTGSHELYDLSADPRETKNLAADMPDVVAGAQRRLAAWVQYQGKLYSSLGDSAGDATARESTRY
jgi:hypothetical protein